jgi:hypothetical protein
MANDKFNHIMQESFTPRYIRYHSASGNVPPFKVGEKDPYPKKGSEGNIGDLQRALNRLKPSLALVDDGDFGTKTKNAITGLGYKYSLLSGLSSSEFYKILNDANKGDASSSTPNTTVSEVDMKKLWEKDKAKYGKLSSSPDFDKWLKRQKSLAGIKDFGKGAFTVAMDWLKQKNAGSPTGEDYTPPSPEDTSKIWGMPKFVVIGGGIIIGGALIFGAIALATRKPKQVIVQQIPVAG